MTQQPLSATTGRANASAGHPQQAPSNDVPRQLRTRRKLWLGAHPEYLARTSHALALPLAYDRLVRTYQTPAERQEEGRRQGWARTLEGALVRGEAKRDAAVRQREQGEAGPEGESSNNLKGPEELGSGSRSQRDGDNGLKPLPEEMDENGTDRESEDASSVRAGSHPRTAARCNSRDEEGDGSFTGTKQHEFQGRLTGHQDKYGGDLDVETHVSDIDDAAVDAQWDIPFGIIPADELFGSPDGDGEISSGTPGSEGPSDTSGESPTAHERQEGQMNKEVARLRWEALLTARFIAGADGDFDYQAADHDDALETGWRDSRREEAWFEDESEEWASDVVKDGEQPLMQTGIQDF